MLKLKIHRFSDKAGTDESFVIFDEEANCPYGYPNATAYGTFKAAKLALKFELKRLKSVDHTD